MNWLTGWPTRSRSSCCGPRPPAFVVLGAILHWKLYSNGFSKAQESPERFVRGRPVAECVVYDCRSDAAGPPGIHPEGCQVFLPGYDSVEPADSAGGAPRRSTSSISNRCRSSPASECQFFLVSLVVFLNLGLAGFVLAAVAARFVFPAVSLEGKQMWLLALEPARSVGAAVEQVLDGRPCRFSSSPCAITFTTNLLLQASPFMMMV